MNSKIYRCGNCGNPVNKDGSLLSEEVRDRVIGIIERKGWKDSQSKHLELVYGNCCRCYFEELRYIEYYGQ